MEKRHQVTKIEKYEEIVSNNIKRESISEIILAISVAILYNILPGLETETWAPIALGFSITAATGSLYSMIEAIVKKVVYQGKLDDLYFEDEQEEDQSRSR